MTRTLSKKEKQFADALASGLSPTDAYRTIYSSTAGNRTAQANGRQVARRQRVIEEVERLRRNPSPNNFHALKEFAVEKLLKMAESDPDPRLRHRATTTLLRYANEGLRRQPPPPQTASEPRAKPDRNAIIKELHQIYAAALVNRTVQPPPAELIPPARFGASLVQDVTPESSDDPLAAPDTEFSSTENGGVGVEQPDLGDGPGLPDLSKTAEYQWVQAPGCFGKTSKVRIRVR